MKKFLLMFAIIFVGNFFASNVHAEMKTYEGKDVAMLDFGENDSKIVEKVKNVAKMRAMTAAREKAGVYLKSFSQILNGNLTDDEVFAVINNISEILDVNFEKLRFTADEIHGRYKGKEGYLYKATVIVKIDDAEISKYLNRNSQEKEKIILQNKNLHRTIIEIDDEFENLRETVAQKTPEQIQAELQKIDNEISAAEKISEGNKFAYQENYSAAVEKYNEAIEINPNSNVAKKNLETIYSKQNTKNYNSLLQIKVVEFEGIGTAPDDRIKRVASQAFSQTSGIALALGKAAEYLTNYVSASGKDTNSYKIKQMITKMLKNMKIISKEFLDDGRRCKVKIKFADEDITKLENFLQNN